MGKLKRPPVNQGPRIAAHEALENPDAVPPKFSLRYLAHDYCISHCNQEQKAASADKLRLLSQLTWAQIRQAPRHGLGYEKIPRHTIRAGIPKIITDDVDLIAFRFHALAPMVGFRGQDGTSYILWFDRNLTLYDHR